MSFVNHCLIKFLYLVHFTSPVGNRLYQSLFIALSVVIAGHSSAIAESLKIESNSQTFPEIVAQAITPNADGTGTVVNTDGNTSNIEGGSLSGNGENLFHSFEQFGLSSEEIANFRSNPSIRNIFGRINGGDPSVINGLIQVLGGNSNLLLLNPAGIIFGSEAQLNIPADFTATTATGIGFGDGNWFNAIGENSYQSLVGTPSQFAFDAEKSGAIINNGKFSLSEGSNITFLAGNVINTGEVTAPEGSITLSAVPGSSTVKISQPGHLLSLEIEPPRDDQGKVLPFAAKDLPGLLTISDTEVDAGLTVNTDNSITIDDTAISFLPEPELAIASGSIDVSGNSGGEVNVLGNKVGLLSSNIDASGTNAGGDIRIGGDYQGSGTVPNAKHTIVDDSSTVAVDATENGAGGQAIIWSDSLTRFTGRASARGGANGGDGGLVEISGKDLLVFTGTVDASSPLGKAGELLLDPKNIIVGNDDTALASIFSSAPESEQSGIAGFGISVATVGEDLLVGSPANVSGGENNAGQTFLFDNSGNALRTYDNPNSVQGGFFGFSVAAAGNDQLLVGAPRNTVTGSNGEVFSEAGQVFLFNKTDSAPLQTFNNPNPTAAFISQDNFSGAVPLADTNFGAAIAAVDGDRFLIGAPGHTVTQGENQFERAGQAFLIDQTGQTLQTFNNPNPTAAGVDRGTGNSFGISVASIGNNQGVIGAPRNSNGAGQAFVFSLENADLQGTFNNPQTDGSGFGQSVTRVSDNRLAIGAPRNSNGVGQVFLYNSSDTEQPLTTFNNPGNGGDFGDAVANAGVDRLLVGARSNSSGSGQAFLFNTANAEQPLQTFNNPSNSGAGAFGTSVASIDEDRVLIGASENDFQGLTNSGEAFISPNLVNLSDENFNGVIEFSNNPGATFTILPETITNITNTGTDVTLQANNDLTISPNQQIISDNPNGDGGNITLQAGRNIEIDSNITTDNGNLNILANATAESGTVAEFRDAGIAEIAIADGVTLNAGTGDVALNIADGAGSRGNITIDNVTANNVALTTGVGTVNVAGSINATENITLAGNEINLQGGENSVASQNITLRGTDNQNINVGNDENTSALDLTTTDVLALGNTGQITIGDVASTGTIRLFNSVATNGSNPFQSAVNIPGGDTLVGPNLDTNWQITGSGNLNSVFPNGLAYGDVENIEGGTGNDTFSFNGGTQESVDGGAGNNTIIGNDSVNAFNINGQDSGNINEATDFASVQNLTGGNANETFSFIGDNPQITGNIDGGGGINNLDYNAFTGLGENDFQFDLASGQATGINGTFTSIDDALNIPNSLTPEVENQIQSEVTNRREETTNETNESDASINIASVSLSEGSDDNGAIALLPRIDADFTDDYDNYYDREEELEVNLAQVQQTLKNIEESTGAKPALIYAAFFPTDVDAIEGRNSNILPQADDELELITVTAKGVPTRQRIEGVTRSQVTQSARRFTNSINNIQPEKLFLPHAQQLYKWLIEPIKADLEAKEINNLVFLMDAGLRAIPVAAFHDGDKYLVEDYSVGMMPSMSLTDTRYQDIKDVGLLAMGSETFPADSSLFPLPAVPVEIDIITQQLWSGGSSFQNADFTIDNLQRTQTSKPFGILHLATHAEFNPGTPKNSFIQFGDRKLSLDEVRELGLSNPQVELMVLSACNTALGDRDAEYGFAGLAHQAGVKSALGSLWYVSDQGTLALMSKFYQELKTAPIKAEALRQAQIAMINKKVRLENGKLITDGQTFDLPPDIEGIDITHPNYWSPFTIIGNPW